MKPVVALIGEGVQSRVNDLRRLLDSRWEARLYKEGIDTEPTAAIGMPAALVWKTHFPSLQFLQLPGAGTDGLMPDNLPNGCSVANVYEHEGSIAEYVFMMMLRTQEKWLGDSLSDFKKGQWPHLDRIGHGPRPSLAGMCLALVGFGHIGRRLADVGLALNMQVAAWARTRNRPGLENYLTKGVKFAPSLQAVAESADFLVISVPSNSETKKLINKDFIQHLPDTAVVINVARGDVIDEKDLYDALVARRLKGAVLDVWTQYPSSKDQNVHGSPFPFHALNNVLATSHLAAHTNDMISRRWSFMAANLNRFLKGEPLQNEVLLPAAKTA